MILTAEEYRALGFTADDDEQLLQCLKRAEYILSGITQGRAEKAVLQDDYACGCVKRACALQTYILMKELSVSGSISEKVSIGDFSYSTEKSQNDDDDGYDLTVMVIHCLRSSGILFGGLEVRE